MHVKTDLDKRIAGHVLDAVVRLMHEFEEFVDDGFKELPMSTKEARILPNNIHNVGSDDGLINEEAK